MGKYKFQKVYHWRGLPNAKDGIPAKNTDIEQETIIVKAKDETTARAKLPDLGEPYVGEPITSSYDGKTYTQSARYDYVLKEIEL